MDNQPETPTHATHLHQPIEKIIVTYDAAHGRIAYQFENTNHANALQRLEFAKHYIFADMLKQEAQTNEH